MVRLCGKPLRVTRSAAWEGPPPGSAAAGGGGYPGGDAAPHAAPSERDVGANLFVGGLAPDVDEKALYDTFSAFGAVIATPRIVRDPETGLSKGFGFVSFDSFEAADAAVEAMNGQFFFNRAIVVTYAFRKDSKSGERHGTPAERLIASQKRARAMAEAQRGGGAGGAGGRTSLLPQPHTRFADGPPGAAAPPMPINMPPPPPMPMHGGYHHHHMPPPPHHHHMMYGGAPMPPPPPMMMAGGAMPLPPNMPPPPPPPPM
jgi:splicing factor 3B subunit 4